MSNALHTAVQSMHNDMRRLETISQNMVNIATPGYKRAIPQAQAFEQALAAGAMPAAAGAPAMHSVIDLSAGSVKQTGRALDVAIGGDGYFEFDTPEGLAYSRAGDFHIDAQGRLVSAQGHVAQGIDGPLQIGQGPATIDHAGRILRAGQPLGQLKVVLLAGPLAKTGSGLLRAAAAATPATPELQPGFLESSNVTPMREMVALMETARHFESMQKLFQGYDDALGNAIQKLGQF